MRRYAKLEDATTYLRAHLNMAKIRVENPFGKRAKRKAWGIEGVEALLLTRTDAGRGGPNTVGHKLMTGELTREEAAQATGAPLAVIPLFWDAEAHQRLVASRGAELKHDGRLAEWARRVWL